MKFYRPAAIILLFAVNASAADSVKACPADQLCPKFKATIERCSKNRKSKSCDDFVNHYKKLASTYDCKRPFDTEPVPAVWLCDDGSTPGPHERGAALLSKLRTKTAMAFFASEKFRSTLDGDIAEQFMEKSKKLSKRLKR